jgi:putative hydrolase of the HAD superfamily
VRARLPRRSAADRRVRAVTVDCWGTLLLDGPASDDRYMPRRLAGIRAGLADVGIDVKLDDLRAAYDAAGCWLAQLWREHRDVPGRDHVITLLDRLDPGLAARIPVWTLDVLVRAYTEPAAVVPPACDPGARAALGTLARRGVALAVISNTMRTPGAVMRMILDQQRLLPLFHRLTFSDERGIRKPASRIFLDTLSELDVPPEDAVHVGDDALLDVQGARDAGMRVIQITPDGRPLGPTRPDAVIRHLGQLPQTLARFER